MNLVGVLGMAGSGKDTFADFLVQDHNWTKIALADPIKRFCQEVFGFTDEQLWGPSSKRNAGDRRYCISEDYAEAAAREEAAGNHERAESYAKYAYLTPRFALQQLGTEWGRRCWPDVWIDYGIKTAKSLFQQGRGFAYYPTDGVCLAHSDDPAWVRSPVGVVISDVRFKNEVAAIKKNGGKLVRLRRGQPLQGLAGTHQSETEMQDIPDALFDCIIDNREMSLDELRAAAGAFVKEHF